jgi:hypothetical protein
MVTMVVPEGVKSLGQACFYSCQGLKTVELPNTLDSIKAFCFQWCRYLTTLTIPKSVKYIGEKCFVHNLKTVKCCWETPPDSIAVTAFESSALPNTLLYVPKGCTDNYKSKEPWSKFGCIKEYDADGDVNGVTAPTGDMLKVEYFTTDGHRAATNARGLVISRKTYSGGRTAVGKELRR